MPIVVGDLLVYGGAAAAIGAYFLNVGGIKTEIDKILFPPGGNPPPTTCQTGYHLDTTTNTCVADTPVCQSGYHISGGQCVPDTQTCQTGYHLVNGICVQDTQTPPPPPPAAKTGIYVPFFI